MRTIEAILLAALCWAGVAAAQGPPGCSDDVKRFCPDMRPGNGRIVKCLRQHDAALSAACKDALAHPGGGGRGPARGSTWTKECEADLAKHCPGVKRGGGRLVQCLQRQHSHLSPGCRGALDGRPGAARAATPGATAPAATAGVTPPAAPAAATPAAP